MNYTELEKKVKSMSAHDIIMAMVDGLRSPRTVIDMSTFGSIRMGICFGCAATNAILHIMDVDKEKEVVDHILECESQAYSLLVLGQFENAIDCLRRDRVDLYNRYAMNGGFAPITPIPGQELPWLGDNYTENQLKEYEKLAKYQLTA